MADIIDFLYEKTLPKLEEDLKGCKDDDDDDDDDDEPAELRQSYKLSEIFPNLWNTPTPPPLITRETSHSYKLSEIFLWQWQSSQYHPHLSQEDFETPLGCVCVCVCVCLPASCFPQVIAL